MMKKTSLALLCMALCMTLVMPVSAKMSEVTLTGNVTFEGVANVKNTKNGIQILVFSKKPYPTPIGFTEAWPSILSGYSTNDIELSISINKKNFNVKMEFAWGEYKNPSITRYVLRETRGTATSITETEAVTTVVIVIEQVKIYERVKPNSLIEKYSGTGLSIEFTLVI